MASSVPAVKAALLATFTTALAPVPVLYGSTAPFTASELLLISGTTWQGEDWVTIGNRRRDERYTVDCGISVAGSSDSVQTATERLYALFALAEAALIASPTLGVAGVISVECKPVSEQAGGSAPATAFLRFGVYVHARI